MQGSSYPGGLSTRQRLPNLKLGQKNPAIDGTNRRTLRAASQMLREALACTDKLKAKQLIANAYQQIGTIRL